MAIRRLELPSELDLVVELVLESFQYPENPEWSIQEDEKESIGTQLAAVRRLWPILRLLTVLYPSFRDQLLGYIWEEGDEPAGMVMYQPNSILGGRTWIISNVGVLPAHRRKGIGRRLVEAGLADMREREVSTVRLQVLAGNTPAYELYRSLGFEKYASTKALERLAAEALTAPRPLAGYRMVRQSKWDWEPRFELASRVTPERVRAFRPLVKSDYFPPLPLRLLEGLMTRLGGLTTLAFAVCPDEGESGGDGPREAVFAVGRGIVRTKPGGVNQMGATIDPSHPATAGLLVRHVAAEVEALSPGRRTILPVPDWQPALLEAATEVGFEVAKEWHSLGMALD